MSVLPDNVTVEYRVFKAKIIGCTMNAGSPWYKDRIGEVVEVQERSYFKDGKPDGASYWATTRPNCQWCGLIYIEDFTPVKEQV